MPKSKRGFRSSPKKTNKQVDSPVRNLVECSPHRITGGLFVDGLMEFDAEYESSIESPALDFLLLCHDVRKIASQASKEPYCLNGRLRHHVPDFTVNAHVDGLRLEVKALSNLLGSEATMEKYLSVARGYRERGVPFAFLVDAQLAESPLAASMSLLSRYVLSPVPAERVGRVLVALRRGELRVPALMAEAKVNLVDVWSLIARRQICFNAPERLNPHTSIVSLPGQPYEGMRLESILCSTRFGGLLAEMAMGRRPTNKSLLADAASWRLSNIPVNPSGFVGGFKRAKPLRPLTESEQVFRVPGRRRDFTSGIDLGWPYESE